MPQVLHRDGIEKIVLAAPTAAAARLWIINLEHAADYHLAAAAGPVRRTHVTRASVMVASTRVAAANDLDGKRLARREAMEAAQRKARLAAQTVGRVALEVRFIAQHRCLIASGGIWLLLGCS